MGIATRRYTDFTGTRSKLQISQVKATNGFKLARTARDQDKNLTEDIGDHGRKTTNKCGSKRTKLRDDVAGMHSKLSAVPFEFATGPCLSEAPTCREYSKASRLGYE